MESKYNKKEKIASSLSESQNQSQSQQKKDAPSAASASSSSSSSSSSSPSVPPKTAANIKDVLGKSVSNLFEKLLTTQKIHEIELNKKHFRQVNKYQFSMN